MRQNPRIHPYIPNTVPEVKQVMLQEIGVSSIEELYRGIPESLRFRDQLQLQPALTEYELQRHIEKLLSKNTSAKANLNFLGAGCWQHFIPAVCDEISQRSEFVTAYAGEPYEDHGRFQTLFEYQSLLAELVDMDVVNVPTFDWAQAAATALRMAVRITGKQEVLLPAILHPDRRMIIENYLSPEITCVYIDAISDTDSKGGTLDLNDLQNKLTDHVAAIYIENPSYIGIVEHQGQQIADLAHAAGSLFIVGIDPISLGVLKPPSQYGADLVCGDLQPLGIHMQYGGGQSGFIASRDEEKFVMEYPSRLFGIVPTIVEGEYGFGDVAYERTSFAKREKGKESVGTQTALWGITAGVYLALMGPLGMQEVGQTIIQHAQYAALRLSQIKGVSLRFTTPFFKEFVVDFNESGKTVEAIHRDLLACGIFGGKDLSQEYPEWGQCALYCVTEIHTKEDLEQLAAAVKQIVEG
ncbi:aminomethyl-transferring glycine dehydrogenase subunit GcvPA [Paenibacillus sp. SYP-B3998]|uniref:Aminomethyl-transferring glycine dehydrogenase subunit GcvPA n=1 Tax=Paenibacillus sp. SYP-B3998 TaxID=2678564 RepID=A0A6G3ZSE3_9BACL|nr:aminomethyl-transferring glycine dehydrogenase subunit GcvPA [Paenibacillus sp. SYP-B3998]NEW04958.1 aminomethyl-transferring glycine dehydrogenase subunit GcvPA [Paenibacillus sp. SYP-B3998]